MECATPFMVCLWRTHSPAGQTSICTWDSLVKQCVDKLWHFECLQQVTFSARINTHSVSTMGQSLTCSNSDGLGLEGRSWEFLERSCVCRDYQNSGDGNRLECHGPGLITYLGLAFLVHLCAGTNLWLTDETFSSLLTLQTTSSHQPQSY